MIKPLSMWTPLQVSAGGLVSALMGVHNFRAKWIGWPGVHTALFVQQFLPRLQVSNLFAAAIETGLLALQACMWRSGPDRDSLTAALSKEGYIPVYLDEKTVSSRQQSLPHLSCCTHPAHSRLGISSPAAKQGHRHLTLPTAQYPSSHIKHYILVELSTLSPACRWTCTTMASATACCGRCSTTCRSTSRPSCRRPARCSSSGPPYQDANRCVISWKAAAQFAI